MGILCSLFCGRAEVQEGEEPSPTTPLMQGGGGGDQQEQSAGINTSPGSETKGEEELDHVSLVTFLNMPPQLVVLQKTFKDHARLYNDQCAAFTELQTTVGEFKYKCNPGVGSRTSVVDCLRDMDIRCGKAKLKIRREKHCIHLLYDKYAVARHCLGSPGDVLDTLRLFTRINQIFKSILDRAALVKIALQNFLDTEQEVCEKVTKAELSHSQEQDTITKCQKNFSMFRRLPASMDFIQKHTDIIFREFVAGTIEWLHKGGRS